MMGSVVRLAWWLRCTTLALGTWLWAGTGAARAPVIVWYRAAEGCPNGESFIARLSQHGLEGRIARIGDRIDFVVTLGRADHGSSATLERQTTRGTVALRELHAATCDAVADALALTLVVGTDPDAPAAESEPMLDARRPLESGAAAPVGSAPAPSEIASPPAATALVPGAHDEGPAPRAPRTPRRREVVLRVGAQGTLGSLLGGNPLWGGGAFAELGATRGLRAAARGSFLVATADGPLPDVRLSLWAGRLEGCPITLGRALAVTPCAGLDAGMLRASSDAVGGHAASDAWFALWAIARLRYEPTAVVGYELQGGLSAPLARYRVVAQSPTRTLAEVRPVGVGLGAGISVRWP